MQNIIDYIENYLFPKAELDFRFLLDFLVSVYKGFVDMSSILVGGLNQPLNRILLPFLENNPSLSIALLSEFFSRFTVMDVVLGNAFGLVLLGILWKWAREWLPW